MVLILVRMGLLYLLDKDVYFTKFIVHEHKKSCDFNLPSIIDLQSTENNMPSSIKKNK